MPISTVIYLIPLEDIRLRPTMGHHAHAAFLSLLQTGRPRKGSRSPRHLRAETVHRLATHRRRRAT